MVKKGTSSGISTAGIGIVLFLAFIVLMYVLS